MARTLTEAEFERVKQEVLANAPPNLDEATFTKWIGPALTMALEQAETDPSTLLEGSALGRLASNAWAMLNPVAAVTGLYEAVKTPEATGQTIAKIVGAQGAEFGKARDAYRQGRYWEAAGHGAAGLLPVVGPVAAAAGTQIGEGDIAGGIGAGLGLVGGVVAPSVVRQLPLPKSVPLLPSLARGAADPVGEAVHWAQRQKIPVDPATATGNPFLRGVQRLAEESLVGSFLSRQARERQAAALETTAGRLAEQAAPGRPTTPELAGEAVRAGVLKTGQARAREARQAYGEVRKAEENLLHADYVPDDLPRPVKERLRQELGGELPTPAEIQELRRIYEELDAVPFQPGKLVEDITTLESTYSHRAPGAPVYHEILQEAPGTSNLTRAEVQRSIALALRTGRLTNAARGAIVVAKKRLAEGGWRYQGLSSPILPPEAGLTQSVMKLPVDLRPAKAALQPLYQRLLREKELTGILQGTKARTLAALDSLMTAGDHAPLSVVDTALSDLKRMARGDVPELKTAGEGAAGAAVAQLDEAVRAAAQRGGPDVAAALARGRQATRAKYVSRDLLTKKLKSEEGVSVFQKLTAPNDANIRLLRVLRQQAPAALPQVGRAFLEQLFEKATAEGGFQRSQGLLASWQKLGPETKRLLFKDAAHIKALDNFFLIAKKLAENPNPSGSALTAFKGAEATALFKAPLYGASYSIGAGLLANLLLSPTTTQLLLQGLRLPVGAKAARTAWASALERAIEQAGPELVPALAEEPEPTSP